MRIVVGITGASGVLYGIRLLEVLQEKAEIHLIISETGKEVIDLETGIEIEKIKNLASFFYENDDLSARISSGSFEYEGEIVVPCSMKTLAHIANGYSDNLITRVADVCLKEGRKLILVPRETPLSLIHLENMLKAKKAGAVIMPASPPFYPLPKTVVDVVDIMVGRILDVLGVENDLYRRWK
ncbi:MAG: UbiX family flavin prenyltransferase [Candidatus Syntropharchaeia archaeon]